MVAGPVTSRQAQLLARFVPPAAPRTIRWARARFDELCQTTCYDDKGFRATFYTTGMEHSATSAIGTGWERTPWHPTQRAAWEALKKIES
jgi:hypothetical protein